MLLRGGRGKVGAMADAGLGKQTRAQKQLNEFQRGVKSIGTRKDRPL